MYVVFESDMVSLQSTLGAQYVEGDFDHFETWKIEVLDANGWVLKGDFMKREQVVQKMHLESFHKNIHNFAI